MEAYGTYLMMLTHILKHLEIDSNTLDENKLCPVHLFTIATNHYKKIYIVDVESYNKKGISYQNAGGV